MHMEGKINKSCLDAKMIPVLLTLIGFTGNKITEQVPKHPDTNHTLCADAIYHYQVVL